MLVLDGKKLAQEIELDLADRVSCLKKQSEGSSPVLATILVGNDPASETYVQMKINACHRVGLGSRKVELAKETTTQQLLGVIDELNSDDNVVGILLQHPVPNHIDERACFERILPSKDVDGVTTAGFGRMSMGLSAYGSATPAGIIKLIEHYNIEVEGKKAVVVGRSPILGKPLAMMLLQKNATVTTCHSKTENLVDIIRSADIIVGALGKPEYIKKEWIKPGAVVIDAGYHPGRVGDVELDGIESICSAYTPVPGGVGPMTIATLLAQSVEAAESRLV